MNGLDGEFGDDIEFVYLDWDNPDDKARAQEIGATRRSSYYLLDGGGMIMANWFGPLSTSQANIAKTLDDALSAQN